jgi:hypothetical protein
MDQSCQGQWSTHPLSPTTPLITKNNPDLIIQEPGNAMTNLVLMHAHKITGLLFTNQMGHFPVTSNRGYAYLFIFYGYNANYIASVSIKTCTKEELL